MNRSGFTYVEVLVSLFLILEVLLIMGFMNMTALHLIGRGKINQRATLLLIQKIDDLKSCGIETLEAGEFEQTSGNYVIRWKIDPDIPYFGCRRIHCRIFYTPTDTSVIESLFYRSE